MNDPYYWVISQVFHVDAEAAMCAVADSEEPEAKKWLDRFVSCSYRPSTERTYQEVCWFRRRLCKLPTKDHDL